MQNTEAIERIRRAKAKETSELALNWFNNNKNGKTIWKGNKSENLEAWSIFQLQLDIYDTSLRKR